MLDDFDQFIEYDFTMGSDEVECPHCKERVPVSLMDGDEILCPKCGMTFMR
jgi:DNA-directed RNA polymerase subunit RPC12/RpoP